MHIKHFILFLLLMCVNIVSAQTVKGIVTDAASGETLIGVSVKEKGGDAAAVSDMDGKFSIKLKNAKKAVLVFSYVGMEPLELQAREGVEMKVLMSEQSNMLDQLVVVAYGQRRKGTITGSVSTVDGTSVNDAPVASFDQAMQGKAAGLVVLQESGDPSAPATFQIRGTNSINAGTEPLFIVDGVQVSASEFSAINPADIESYSVLKDASSTSIYGARAANGVIVISTKRGKVGETGEIKLRAQYGFSNLAYGHWTQMDTRQRLDYEELIGVRVPGTYDREALEKVNVNWRDLVFRDNAPTQNYDLSIGGGTSALRYFISGSYFSQDGVAIGSDFSRVSLRTNVEAQVTKWLRIGTNSSMALSKAHEADYGSYSIISPISASKFMLPYWTPYRPDGSYATPGDTYWRGDYDNPLQWNDNNPLKRNRFHLISSSFVQIEPIKDLKVKSLIGIDGGDVRSDTYSFPSYVANYGIGLVGKSFSRNYNITWTNTATYEFDYKAYHHFNVLLGHEMIKNGSDGFTVVTRGQSNDKLLTLATGTAVSNWSDSKAGSSYLSFFGRGEYNYLRKYYVDLSMRRDASSKFGSDSRWATFWSLGAMWNLKEEKMFAKTKWLSTFQLSASYGTSGNSSIPNYDHLSLYSAGPQYAGMPGIAPYSRGNEDLTWEKLSTLNVGVKAGFWNKVDVGVEFYNKRTSDMLMEVPITLGNGFATRWDNIGVMINRGVELNVNATLFKNKDITWSAYANASYNYNEITELYNGLDEYELPGMGLMLKVGHSYGEQYAVRYAGVNPANGDALWYTKDGGITNVYNEEDKVLTGKSYMAPWAGGFGTSFNWKGLQLDMHFSWVGNRYVMNNDRYFDESNGLYSSAYNQSTELLNAWQKPGDITTIPRYGVSPEFDTHLMENASFLRLKNVMVSYVLPKHIINKVGLIKNVRVFGQAQNLFTFTKFSGMDPESSANVYQATYPMSRQFTFGVEVGF